MTTVATPEKMKVTYVPVGDLKPADYNPRKHSPEQAAQLKESLARFGFVDPVIANRAPGRENVVIGGHFRLEVAKELGYEAAPVVFVDIPDLDREKELNLRLNKNVGEFDLTLLAEFDESFLSGVGFSTEDLDDIFPAEEENEVFDLAKELKKIGVGEVSIEPGQIYEIDGSRLMCGDSTVEADVLKLFGDERADMTFTDPPYVLDYLRGKRQESKKEGFGLKKNRAYIGTETLPPDFTEKWMANTAKIQKPDFAIMIFEHPKNLRLIWNELEKHWKYRNTVVWHVPNRVQGFAAKYKLFNKHDIALVGTAGSVALNIEPEDEPLFQSEYENALLATSGAPQWEGYEAGKKICPTDFASHAASDAKHSGQGVIFGTKPLELLIPYLKVMTKRGDLVHEPFGGSGSTLVASVKLGRRCFTMEKCPAYAEVIRKRWEKQTGKTARLIDEGRG